MGKTGRNVARAADAAEDLTDSRAFILAARAGYIAAGILHLLIGAIALRVAFGGAGSADQSGALSQLDSSPGGTLLLWACFLGSTALALFLLGEVLFGANQLRDRDRASFRAKNGVKAVVYASIGSTFAFYALGGSRDSSSSTQATSTALMSHPAGAALLVAVGLGVMAVGGYFAYSGITRRFGKNLRGLPSGTAGKAFMGLGSAGYVAKGAALLVLGMLFVVATAKNNPAESTGLDGALKSLQEQPFGAGILGIIAAGLIAYGVFMVIRARYQRM